MLTININLSTLCSKLAAYRESTRKKNKYMDFRIVKSRSRSTLKRMKKKWFLCFVRYENIPHSKKERKVISCTLYEQECQPLYLPFLFLLYFSVFFFSLCLLYIYINSELILVSRISIRHKIWMHTHTHVVNSKTTTRKQKKEKKKKSGRN